MPKGTIVRKYSDGYIDIFYPNKRLITYNQDGSIYNVSNWEYVETPKTAAMTSSAGLSYIEKAELDAKKSMATLLDIIIKPVSILMGD